MRVLRLISDLKVGGVQRQMLRSAQLLREAGVETEICCQNKSGALADDFKRHGFTLHLLPFRSRLDPIALWRLRRLARDRDIQIVHAHQYQSNIAANMAFLGARGIKIINSYHSFRPVYTPTQARQVRWTRGIPAAFVAVSEAVKVPLVDLGIPAERVRVIYNGVPVPDAPAPFPPRAPGAPVELIYAGRFVKQKRLDLLIDLLSHCARQGVPFHCRLFGEGPTWKAIQRRVQEKDLEKIVELPGVTHEVAARLAEADLYITVSEREGFANALLECCAVGRGFLASPIPPHREMKGDSEAGILLPDDPEAWARTLADFTENPARITRIGAAAFQRVQTFSDQSAADSILSLYKSLA